MENWAKERILDLFAKHYKTQQVIPNEIIEQLNEPIISMRVMLLRQLNFGI